MKLTPVQLRMLQICHADGISDVRGLISPRTLRVLLNHGLVERVVAGEFRAGSGLVWVATQLGQAVLERRGKLT